MRPQSIEQLQEFINVARGQQPAELVLKNTKVVSVFSGEILDVDVAIFGEKIAGLGSYHGELEIDLMGRYLVPGFIDSHVHMESSKLLPWEYSRAVVPRGTTTVVMDPHEIANVLGLQGIEFMLGSGSTGPLTGYAMLPSCVPATALETSGSRLDAPSLEPFLQRPGVLGIGELMDYPGLLAGSVDILKKVQLGRGKRVDGHAPTLTGKELCAYIGTGIHSDHECTTRTEAEEKLRLGMYVMIREGSVAKNLEALLPVVSGTNVGRFLFATDDRGPEDLLEEGHLDHMIRQAIVLGLDPLSTIRIATSNAACYFKLDDIGAIAPGYQADLVVLEDLKRIRALEVFKAGKLVAQDGKLLWNLVSPQIPETFSPMNVNWSGLAHLSVAAEGERIKVIELIPGQIQNRYAVNRAKVEGGVVVPDLERDVLKVAVIERHRATGNTGVGFVRGFGLKRGAIGSTVAHDSHNIIVVGTNDMDMKAAAHEVARLRGGQVVVQDGVTLASLPLPVAGLMSDQSAAEVVVKAKALKSAAKRLECTLDDPFMTLSFLALPVIPDLRVTDRGLVDVRKFVLVSLFEEPA